MKCASHLHEHSLVRVMIIWLVVCGPIWTIKEDFPLYRGKLTAIGDFGNKVKQGTGNWKKKFIIITENLWK